MSKYDPLRAFLLAQNDVKIRLSFSQIERILESSLPASSRRHQAWWANEEVGTHSHASAWIADGRRTANVNLNSATVDFVR